MCISFFFFKQKTAYEMRISDWSSDVCSSDLGRLVGKLMDGLRDVARIHRGTFRLTPNQNLIIAGVNSEDRPAIEAVLQEYGIGEKSVSMVRRNSMACVALPTCALAMAESERYLPDLMTKIEALLERSEEHTRLNSSH